MKYFVSILFLLIVGFTACQRRTVHPLAMQQAESLMNARPDSALALLEGMADTLAMLPEEARMYWHLLTIQARDKLYITHTDDSLINTLVRYYESSGDKDRLMMAYFYQGSTYRDMNDVPRALKAFQQAVDLNIPNLDLLAKAYNQMGSLFMYQGLHDEVIRVNHLSINTYLKQGRRNRILFAQRDIARIYEIKEQTDSALYYYKEACNTALLNNDSVRYYDFLGELGGFYYKLGNNNEAFQMLQQALHQTSSSNKSHIYSILGHIYYEKKMWDSAYFYYNQAAKYGNIYKQYQRERDFSLLEERKGNTAQAISHLRKAFRLKDSIDQITQTEAIAKINSLYNYQHTEAENARLSLEREKQRSLIFALGFGVSFFLLLGGIYIVFLHKQKQKEGKRRKAVEDLFQSSQEAICNNEKKIAELDVLLKQTKETNDSLEQKLLRIQQEKLRARNEEITRQKEEQEVRLAVFKQSALYRNLLDAAENKINMSPVFCPNKWIEIHRNIEVIYPGMTSRLRDICRSVSNTELRVCWLSKLGIAPSRISVILVLSRQAVTNARASILQKAIKSGHKFDNFAHFIEEI